MTTAPVVGSDRLFIPGERFPSISIQPGARQITNTQRWQVSVTVTTGGNPAGGWRAEISIRGSSSAKHPKKPYRLELQDENGDDVKLSLLGMPKESDWILYPAYLDKTMIRDVLAYELWRQMGYLAPRTRYVHLVIFTNSVPSVSPVENSSSSNDFASIRVFSGQSSSLSNSLPCVLRV